MSVLREAVANPELYKVGAVAAGEAAMAIGSVVLKNHRELTHESLRLGRITDLGCRAVAWFYGTYPRDWARVHEVHHRSTDADEGAILQTADLLEYMDVHPEFEGPDVPEIFDKLDPLADLSGDDVRRLGARTRERVANRYVPRESYTFDEAESILRPERHAYMYERRPRGRIMRLLRGREDNERPDPEPGSLEVLFPELRDPHSPLLHEHGAPGIQYDGVRLYSEVGTYFAECEAKGELPGGDRLDELVFDRKNLGKAAGFIGTTTVMAMILKDPSLHEPFLYGGAAYAVGGGFLQWAGNTVNAWGHAGRNLWSAVKNKLQPKPDGTVTSKANRMFRLLTADEASNQEEHHNWPWKIAYTMANGVKKFTQAPFGTVVDSLAKRHILMKPGPQFGNPEVIHTNDGLDGYGRFRPDMPSAAVLELQKIRAAQFTERCSMQTQQPGAV